MVRKLTALLCAVILALSCITGALAENVPERAPLEKEELLPFFKNALFVGDSVTRQLRVYVNTRREEGNFDFESNFVCATSYSLYAASRRTTSGVSVVLTYHGSETPMFRVVEKEQPHTVFILLGVNDYIGEKIDRGIEFVEHIVDQIGEVAPQTRIVFISLTPVTRKFCNKKDYQPLWDKYNVALKETCERRGADYLDLATPLKDEDGYLTEAYSSDGLYHLSTDGMDIWLDVLMNYAQKQYLEGNWTPGK